MSADICTMESIVTSEYCRIRLCLSCNMVHFDLPYRVSFQFEGDHFLGMVDAFMKAGDIIRLRNNIQEGKQPLNIVKIDKYIN